MLEIVVLYFVCKSLGDKLREKGRKPLMFQVLLVISWFVAQAVVGFSCLVIMAILNGDDATGGELVAYMFGWIGSAAAAAFWFFIVHLMPAGDEPLPYDFRRTRGAPAATPYYNPPTDPQNPYAPPRSRN